MHERKPWYFKFKKFTGPIIMSGRDYYEHLHNLQQQVEELTSIDSGLAQTCHCSEPCHCEEERAYWTKEREGIANNIKTALML
jgi:hypothetical protein